MESRKFHILKYYRSPCLDLHAYNHTYVYVCVCVCLCTITVGSNNNYSQYDDTSSGSETIPLNPTAPARGAAVPKLEHQTLLDIDNPEQNANSFGKPFESSVSKLCAFIEYLRLTTMTQGRSQEEDGRVDKSSSFSMDLFFVFGSKVYLYSRLYSFGNPKTLTTWFHGPE